MNDVDYLWYELLEDYFGAHVKNPERWEEELRGEFPDITNEGLVSIIRKMSRTMDQDRSRRKINLSDLRTWVRGMYGQDEERPEGCSNCEGTGWLHFARVEGKYVVYALDGGNHASCPCTCGAGQRNLESMCRNETVDRDSMSRLQQIVLEAGRNPIQPPPLDTTPRPAPPPQDSAESGEAIRLGDKLPF